MDYLLPEMNPYFAAHMSSQSQPACRSLAFTPGFRSVVLKFLTVSYKPYET